MKQITVTGRVGGEPKLFEGENGGKTATVSVACNEKRTDRAGDTVAHTDWYEVKAFGREAEFLQKQVHRGDRLLVQGVPEYRTYEKDGQERTVNQIVLRPGRSLLEVLDAKPMVEPKPSHGITETVGPRAHTNPGSSPKP